MMRFPSSTERGDLNFFDELGGVVSGHGEPFKPSRASLRSTRSADWITGKLGDDTSMAAQQQQRRTSRSSNSSLTTTTQTSLLPFAHYNTKFASSSSSTSNLKSKGSLRGSEMSGSRGGVPTMSFRAVSMGSMSRTTSPVDSSSGNYSLFSL